VKKVIVKSKKIFLSIKRNLKKALKKSIAAACCAFVGETITGKSTT